MKSPQYEDNHSMDYMMVQAKRLYEDMDECQGRLPLDMDMLRQLKE